MSVSVLLLCRTHSHTLSHSCAASRRVSRPPPSPPCEQWTAIGNGAQPCVDCHDHVCVGCHDRLCVLTSSTTILLEYGKAFVRVSFIKLSSIILLGVCNILCRQVATSYTCSLIVQHHAGSSLTSIDSRQVQFLSIFKIDYSS